MTPLPPLAGRHAGRYLTVSIHDVSPRTLALTKEILARLETVGARHFSLLVIPDHHAQGHFLDDPKFCNWMHQRIAQGDEIVIHGYYHRRAPRPSETLREKITTRFYTAGEGEFFDISGAEALRLVSQAREEFRKLGIDPEGFVAPAWLLSAAGESALRKLGLKHTTRLTTLYHLPSGRSHATQSLVWSARSGWRRVVSRLWNARLFRRLSENPLMRIGIHPVDFQHPALWQQIETLTTRALADRTPATYLEWVVQATTEPPPATTPSAPSLSHAVQS